MGREHGMEECARLEAAIARWEETGTFSRSDLQAARLHVAACATCSRRCSALVPLLERDAGEGAFPDRPAAGLADAVMSRVRFSTPRRPIRRRALAAVAAACLLAAGAAGFLLARAASAPASDEVVVRFELEAPGAASVALVGSFTDWDASKLMMSDPNHDGVWQVTVRLKKNSVAVYNFVIDGSRWIPDPRSPAQIDDGFGGLSSVLNL